MEYIIPADDLIYYNQQYEPLLKLGLYYVPTPSGFFFYILPEVTVIFCILVNIYQENLIGMYNRREIEVESIH